MEFHKSMVFMEFHKSFMEFHKSFMEFHKSFMEFHKCLYLWNSINHLWNSINHLWNSINHLWNSIYAYFRALRLAIDYGTKITSSEDMQNDTLHTEICFALSTLAHVDAVSLQNELLVSPWINFNAV